MPRTVPKGNTLRRHHFAFVFRDDHRRHKQSWVVQCTPLAAGRTVDNVRVAGDDDRGSVAAGTVLSKEVEDKGFLVDTVRSQLRQFVEAR